MGQFFERSNPLLREASEKLFKALEPLNRGDMMSIEDIQAVIGIKQQVYPWYAIINRVRRLLEESKGITLKNELGVGYYLASHDEQIGEGAVRCRRARRQIARGEKSVRVLPVESLTFEQQRRRAGALTVLESINRSVRESERVQAFLSRPREAAPRLPVQSETLPLSPTGTDA